MLSKSDFQDAIHSQTEAVEINGEKKIILHSDRFDAAYEIMRDRSESAALEELLKFKNQIFDAFGNYVKAIVKQLNSDQNPERSVASEAK